MRNEGNLGKLCIRCEETLTRANVYPYQDYTRMCKKCFYSRSAEYRVRNKSHEKYVINQKISTLSHYSKNLECANCGETDLVVLSVDHINDDGARHRREIAKNARSGGGSNFYRWAKKHNYPSGFQVLCMNCQWIKLSKHRGTYDLYKEARKRHLNLS